MTSTAFVMESFSGLYLNPRCYLLLLSNMKHNVILHFRNGFSFLALVVKASMLVAVRLYDIFSFIPLSERFLLFM